MDGSGHIRRHQRRVNSGHVEEGDKAWTTPSVMKPIWKETFNFIAKNTTNLVLLDLLDTQLRFK